MIEGQRDSEAGEIDKGREGTPWLKKKDLKKRNEGDKKSRDSSGKRKAGEGNWCNLNQW